MKGFFCDVMGCVYTREMNGKRRVRAAIMVRKQVTYACLAGTGAACGT